MLGVTLEFDTFLEIDEVKFDLLRAAPQRQIGNDDVEECRFTGAGFARHEGVLASPFAHGQVLKLGRARTSDRDSNFFCGGQRPKLVWLRRDLVEWHFDTVGASADSPDFL